MKSIFSALVVAVCFVISSPFVYADKKDKGRKEGNRGENRRGSVKHDGGRKRDHQDNRNVDRQKDDKRMRDDRANHEQARPEVRREDRRESRHESREWRGRHSRRGHHHPSHWGGSSWSFYAGVGGFGYYYGPRYYGCHTYYYPVAVYYRPDYVVREHYWYLSSREGICPGHGFAHDDGYCEYWYDDDGGVEVRWWP